MPEISVILPVYNSESYLTEAIASILNQTFTDFEFLIGDDGSSDRSVEIIQHFAQQDSRIQLIQNPKNLGGSATRNRLQAIATGQFIAVMDADDVAMPNRFQEQYDFLHQHPDIVCVGGSYALIDEAGRFLTVLSLPENDADIQQSALAGHGSICHPCALIRREAMTAVGGYDETLKSALDLDLWLRLGEIGTLANLPSVVLHYRLHGNSISETRSQEQRQNARIACERAWQRRGIEGQFEADYAWRPTADPESRLKFMLQYGWWAFNSCQRWTAALYGWRSLKIAPFKKESWALLLSAVLKPMPKKNTVTPSNS